MSNEAAEFMLKEYSRIIDAYHDLHIQKNELIKFYLAFVSLPASIVAVFLSLYKNLSPNAQLGGAVGSLQAAGVYLSLLLVLIGISVLAVMLNIRGEQYLYIQTINATRQYFKEVHGIEEKYLVLPSNRDDFYFGPDDCWGRAFWEGMIVAFTTSMFVGFLTFEVVRHYDLQMPCSLLTVVFVFLLAVATHVWWIESQLRKKYEALGLKDKGASR
jgi:hypothetical protein